MKIQNYKDAKQHVIQLVSNAKNGLCPPFYYDGVHNSVAKKLEIKVKEQLLPLDEGQYLPSSPPVIVIDPRVQDPDRRSFTFFHEVAHHLIKQDDSLIEFLHEHAFNDFERQLEVLCNIGAAEFLAPTEEVRSIIQEQGFQISLIETLDKLFPASKPALAFQLAEASQHQCIIVVCEFGLLPRKASGQSGFLPTSPQQPHLFVQYSAASPSCRYSCGRFVSIPSAHLIHDAYQGRSNLKGKAQIPFTSGTAWDTNCDAYYYLGKVYAVFNITSPPAKEQLSLGLF